MHVNSHALTSVNSVLLQHPVPYLDGNHDRAGLSKCLLIQSQIQCTWRFNRLKTYLNTSCSDDKVTYVVLYMRADDRILPQFPVPLWQPRPFLSVNGAWTIPALTILWRVRRTFTLEVPHGLVTWLTLCKYRPQYLCGFEGATIFGDCIFRVDASGLLTRNGTCPTKSGSLSLSSRSIKALAPDVFFNLSSVRWRMCGVMKYVPTTQHVICNWRKDLAGKCSVVSTVSPT